jgi:hypothetical protein
MDEPKGARSRTELPMPEKARRLLVIAAATITVAEFVRHLTIG